MISDYFRKRLMIEIRRSVYHELVDEWKREHGDELPPKTVLQEWKAMADKTVAQENETLNKKAKVKAKMYYSETLGRKVTIPKD